MATSSEPVVAKGDELECGCVCLRRMDRNANVEPVEGHRPSPVATPSHSPTPSPKLHKLRKLAKPCSPRKLRRVEPEGTGSPRALQRYVSVETATGERSGSPRLVLRYVSGDPRPERFSDKLNTPSGIPRPLATKAVRSEPILTHTVASLDITPSTGSVVTPVTGRGGKDGGTARDSPRHRARYNSEGSADSPVHHGTNSPVTHHTNSPSRVRTNTQVSGTGRDTAGESLEPEDAEVAAIHSTATPRVTFQLGDLEEDTETLPDEATTPVTIVPEGPDVTSLDEEDDPSSQELSSQTAPPPYTSQSTSPSTPSGEWGPESSGQGTSGQGTAGRGTSGEMTDPGLLTDEETVVTSVVPEKHVATMLASNTCTLLLTIDHLL